jgi:hypothetical protein
VEIRIFDREIRKMSRVQCVASPATARIRNMGLVVTKDDIFIQNPVFPFSFGKC